MIRVKKNLIQFQLTGKFFNLYTLAEGILIIMSLQCTLEDVFDNIK